MCASAAIKPAVESPSQSERDASIRLIGARKAAALPNASAAAPINSEQMMPRMKIVSPTG